MSDIAVVRLVDEHTNKESLDVVTKAAALYLVQGQVRRQFPDLRSFPVHLRTEAHTNRNRSGERLLHFVAEIARLANVENITGRIVEYVNARGIGQVALPFWDRLYFL